MTTCRVCAFKLEEASSFCPQCGVRIDAEEENPELLSTQRGLPLPKLVKPNVIRTDDLAKTQKLAGIIEANEPPGLQLEAEDSDRATLVAVPAILDAVDDALVRHDAVMSDAVDVPTDSTLSGLDAAGTQLEAGSIPDPNTMSLDSGLTLGPMPGLQSKRSNQKPVALRNIGFVFVIVGLGLSSMGYFKEETRLSFGVTTLRNVDGLVRLSTPVSGHGPIDILYPGGRKSIHGDDHISFGFDGAQLKLGHHPIPLGASFEDQEIPITADLAVLYRLRVVSFTDRTLEMQLDLAPDVSAKVERGQLRSIGQQTYRWSLVLSDQDIKQRTIRPSLTLRTKQSGTHTLDEEIYIPALYVPVSILSPTPGLIHTNKRIPIRGHTLPNALITYGQEKTVRASETGEFRFEVESKSARGEIPINVSLDGLRTARIKVGYTALNAADRRIELKRLKATYKRLKKEAESVSGPIVLKDAVQDQTVTFSGLLVARHRTGTGSQALIVNPCLGKTKTRCPVWVDYDGLDFSKLGRKVRLVGRLMGIRTYTALDGESRRVPRFLAEVLVP